MTLARKITLLVLVLGGLALAAGLPTRSSAVPTDKPAPVSVPPIASHVLLRLGAVSCWVQVDTDGNDMDCYSIPAGSALVVTDVEWVRPFATPGDTAEFRLGSISPLKTGLLSFATAGGNGVAGATEHYVGGVILTTLLRPDHTTGLEASMRGYLVPLD